MSDELKPWSVPEIWKGGTCYVLGGGPSLAKIDIERLRGQRVIAVNNAYQLARWIDVMYFMDKVWFGWHQEELTKWPGIKVCCAVGLGHIKWLRCLEMGRREGIDDRPTHLSRGSNSGCGAIGLAAKFGVERINLLGFDMHTVDGQHNWHGSHQRDVPPNIYQTQFTRSFNILKKALDGRGIEIVNATPGSSLTTFPIVDPEEVLP